MLNTRQEFKDELFNSLKENSITIVRGDVGIGKLNTVLDLIKDKSLKYMTYRLSMFDEGELDTLTLSITEDTVLILDEMDRIADRMIPLLNNFIHRVTTTDFGYKLYVCCIVNNSYRNENSTTEFIKDNNIMDFGFTLDDYLEYMGDSLLPELKTFLIEHPQYINMFDANPRNWTAFNELIATKEVEIEQTIKDIGHMFVGLPASQALYEFIYGNKTK